MKTQKKRDSEKILLSLALTFCFSLMGLFSLSAMASSQKPSKNCEKAFTNSAELTEGINKNKKLNKKLSKKKRANKQKKEIEKKDMAEKYVEDELNSVEKFIDDPQKAIEDYVEDRSKNPEKLVVDVAVGAVIGSLF